MLLFLFLLWIWNNVFKDLMHLHQSVLPSLHFISSDERTNQRVSRRRGAVGANTGIVALPKMPCCRDSLLIFMSGVPLFKFLIFLPAVFWGDIALDEDDLRMFRHRTDGPANQTDSGRLTLPSLTSDGGQRNQLCLPVLQPAVGGALVVGGGPPPPDLSGCGPTASSRTSSAGTSVVSRRQEP